ncbi:MAG: hypothetical protein KAG89_13875 [Fulvimarina manganoxydans]|uniref:hypothetical protein n=1 Tax=Fulvimarina manganoxydans TaxID=937218 RepID=UPI002354E88B|nr:hypothetical protein [Fulvimarina manganoxydans]MCK5933248.1 hypothetical protein [Fulvimarina manganoxydans]
MTLLQWRLLEARTMTAADHQIAGSDIPRKLCSSHLDLSRNTGFDRLDSRSIIRSGV